MAERPSQPVCEGAVTVVECGEETTPQEPSTVRLKLRKPKSDKRVKWDADTVDNEHMNKRKSKCCCIYKKHREFDESSSSESDDECENCYGHVDHRKKAQGGSEVPASQSPVPCGSGTGTVPATVPPEVSTNLPGNYQEKANNVSPLRASKPSRKYPVLRK